MTGFPERLKDALRESGVSQLELAASLGVSPSSVSMYVCGKREPSLSLLTRICERLSVSPTELLCGRFEEQKALKRALFGTDDAPDGAFSEVLNYAAFILKKHTAGGKNG